MVAFIVVENVVTLRNLEFVLISAVAVAETHDGHDEEEEDCQK